MLKSKPRILFIFELTSDQMGGSVLSALSLIKRIPREQFELTVAIVSVMQSSVLSRELKDHGIEALVIKEVRHLSDFVDVRRTVTMLKAQKPDLVILHNNYFHANPYLPVLARLAGIKGVLVIENSNHPKEPSLLGRVRKGLVGRFVDQTVAVSTPVRTTLLRKFFYSRNRARVILNAIDVEKIQDRFSKVDTATVRMSLGISRRTLIIGSTANFFPYKGLTYLIEAMPSILQVIPNTHLLLVGDGPQRSTIESLIQQLGVSEQVSLVGWQKDVVPYMAIMTVFVLPSLFEGLPLSLLEAMAIGLPVVATDVDGSSEVIESYQTGILVPSCDSHALGEAILLLLRSPELAGTLGQNAREYVFASHNIDRTAKQYLKLFSELVIGFPPAE